RTHVRRCQDRQAGIGVDVVAAVLTQELAHLARAIGAARDRGVEELVLPRVADAQHVHGDVHVSADLFTPQELDEAGPTETAGSPRLVPPPHLTSEKSILAWSIRYSGGS